LSPLAWLHTTSTNDGRDSRETLNGASAWPGPVKFRYPVQELFSFGNGFSLIVTFDYSIDINHDINGTRRSKEMRSILAVRL